MTPSPKSTKPKKTAATNLFDHFDQKLPRIPKKNHNESSSKTAPPQHDVVPRRPKSTETSHPTSSKVVPDQEYTPTETTVAETMETLHPSSTDGPDHECTPTETAMDGTMETFHPSPSDTNENSLADIDAKPKLSNYSPPTNSIREDPASTTPTSTTPTSPENGISPPTAVIPQTEDLQLDPNPLVADMAESPHTQSNLATTQTRSSPREFSQEEIDELLAENSPAETSPAENSTQSNSGTRRFPIWIHKKNFSHQ